MTTAVATRDEQKHSLALVTALGGELSTSLGSIEDLAGLTAAGFLPSLKLFGGKSDAVGRSLISIGHFGIQKGADSIQDLGTSVDIIPLAIKAKAIDSSERGKAMICHDQKHPVFIAIAQRAASDDQELKKKNQAGPSFLLYERSTGTFMEFFCGSFYTKVAANEMLRYLPLSHADCEKLKVKNPNGTYEPRDGQSLTLKAEYQAKAKHPCHAPKPLRCSTPFSVPVAEAVQQIRRFIDVPVLMNGPAETADEASDAAAPPSGRAR